MRKSQGIVWGLAFVAAGLFACGGGGGGDDIDVDPFVLPTYAFSVGSTLDGTPFSVAFSQDGNDYRLSVAPGPAGFTGTHGTQTGAWTLDVGAAFEIDSDLGDDPLFGSFDIVCTSTLAIPMNDPPTAGAWRIDGLPSTVAVQVVVGGVELTVGGGAPVFYKWGAFEDLMGSPGASFEENVAGFSSSIIKFMFARFDLVVSALMGLDEGLEWRNPIHVDGPAWDAGLVLPPTLENPGWAELLWIDRGDGELGPGDDLRWTFGDMPYDDEYCFDGWIDLRNLTEVVDAANRLVRIGFEPYGARDGGISFDDLTLLELEEQAGEIHVIGNLDLEGAFTLVFTAP